MIHRVLRDKLVPSVACLAFLAAGCAPPPPVEAVVQGECADLYGSEVCTWGETLGNDVVAFGATIPVGLVANAPAEMEMVWPPVAQARLALPAEVQSATGFQMLTVFWEAHGHPPGAYLAPHFDFHFYRIPPAEIDGIDCVDTTKPTALPASYALPDVEIPGLGMLLGLCVPAMGMHSLPEAEMTSTEIFEGTMVVGYNVGQPIFIEPMITAAKLNQRASFDLTVPTVPGWPTTGKYPGTFRAEYDSTAQSYSFRFSGLTGAAAPY